MGKSYVLWIMSDENVNILWIKSDKGIIINYEGWKNNIELWMINKGYLW